jgi:hypothetical protein
MGLIREPDGVDFVVAGSDPETRQEAVDFIREYRASPKFVEDVAKAKAILDAAGIKIAGFNADPLPDAQPAPASPLKTSAP